MVTPSVLKTAEFPPSPTEMEALGEKMAYAAKCLEETANRLKGRVDGFTQRGETGGPQEVEPNPVPGTLSSLHYWVRRIDQQAIRLSDATADVATIL